MLLDIATDDDSIDIVSHGFDAGIRVEDLISRDVIAVPVGERQCMMVVGSLAYLAVRPA